MLHFKFFTIFQIFCFYFVFSECNLEEFYRWKQISFEGTPFDKEIEQQDEYGNFTNPSFNQYNNVLKSATRYKDRIFITISRRGPGILSTLNYVPANLPVGSSPKLRPYPDFKTNELHPELQPDKNRIISIYRPRVDECSRLWFVDTGTIQDNEGGLADLIQRPSLWIIDLNTDTVIRRYEIPETVVKQGHGMISLKIDVEKNKCNESFAYISDYLNTKLFVYSFAKNRMWSFSHGFFNNEAKFGKYNIDGFKFEWFDGLFSVTLGRRGADGYRKAFFHALASSSECEISTKVLRNETLSKHPELYQSDFVQIGNRGKLGQSMMHDFDEKTGVVFFGLIARNALTCWNSNKRYTPENHGNLIEHDAGFKYPVDLNIDLDGTLWTLTNNFIRFTYGKLDTNEYNYKLWRGIPKKLINGTICEPKKFANVGKVEDGGPR